MVRIEVKCPYCGVNNEIGVAAGANTREIDRCDTSVGGCDKLFVVEVKFTPEIKIRKIEGEE